MGCRKKITKGVDSLGKQIDAHYEKLEKAKKDGRWDLSAYYPKEIRKLEREMAKKKKLL